MTLPTTQDAAAEGRGWQPIATAPKDGTEILVCSTVRKFPTYNVVYFDRKQCGPSHPWMLPDGQEAYHHAAFTHWMPLPAPPANGRDGIEPR